MVVYKYNPLALKDGLYTCNIEKSGIIKISVRLYKNNHNNVKLLTFFILTQLDFFFKGNSVIIKPV